MTDLNRQLKGREVAQVLCNGSVLMIRTTDGLEVPIVWVNDNGELLTGRPVLGRLGRRIICRGMRELIPSTALALGL
jgi:hypothetical protein